MDVSVIIINYNTFEFTKSCIESIIKNTKDVSYEIVLVDNASVECPPEVFLKIFPELKLIKSEVNLGFAKGNNLGISKSIGSNILLLNSDVVLLDNALKGCNDRIGKLDSPGFLGIRTLNAENKIQQSFAKFPSVLNEFYDLLTISRMSKTSKNYLNANAFFSPDVIYGSFLFFKRSLLESFSGGKLDDTFFMYGEDYLWSWQAHKKGHKNYFLPEHTLIHYIGGSQKEVSTLKKMGNQYKENSTKVLKIINGRVGYLFFCLLNELRKGKSKLRVIFKSQ